MQNQINAPALRYHGSKFRLAPWIMSFFPPHRCYVEPFGGAAGVLLQKPRAYAEVYNDLDGDMVNFFRVLRDPVQCRELMLLLSLTPYARDEFMLAWVPCEDPVEQARRTAVRAQMGFGSAGASRGVTGFRFDTKRRHATVQHDWQRYPANLQAVAARMSGVLIENRPAIEVMQQHDSPDTLHFVDPPYLHTTRVMRQGCYRHEMSDADHIELLDYLKTLQGMVVLSGYPSELYNNHLASWSVQSTPSRVSAGRGTTTRLEVAWLNPACCEHLRQPTLFEQSA